MFVRLCVRQWFGTLAVHFSLPEELTLCIVLVSAIIATSCCYSLEFHVSTDRSSLSKCGVWSFFFFYKAFFKGCFIFTENVQI